MFELLTVLCLESGIAMFIKNFLGVGYETGHFWVWSVQA